MSKVVLVIDKPQQCKSCPCAYEWANRCNRTKKAVIDFDKVQDWCPLKPLPRKLDANDWHRMFSGEYEIREAKGYGWNACLEEILGETE